MRVAVGLLLLLVAIGAYADAPPNQMDNLAKSFPKGEGSRFSLTLADGTKGEVAIYAAESSSSEVAMEYFFNTVGAMFPVELWQQFRFVRQGAGVRVAEGFVLSNTLKTPEKLTPEYLRGLDGLLMSDFLFHDPRELARHKVGEETVSTAAGTVQATHYRHVRDGQTTDYWLSDAAKPIGLVKLVATSKQEGKGYTLSLSTKVRNVGRKINPVQARPLSAEGKALLALPTTR